jgi:hypothetical protein
MPFKKIGENRYKSPSGKIFTAKQVRAYYATKGFKRKPKQSGTMMDAVNKGIKDGSS